MSLQKLLDNATDLNLQVVRPQQQHQQHQHAADEMSDSDSDVIAPPEVTAHPAPSSSHSPVRGAGTVVNNCAALASTVRESSELPLRDSNSSASDRGRGNSAELTRESGIDMMRTLRAQLHRPGSKPTANVLIDTANYITANSFTLTHS